MSQENEKKLFRLKELKEFKVAKDEPDIRGWDVTGQDGALVGHVDELIIDPDLMKVRYLQVKLDKALAVSKGDRYILVPIGRARLVRHEKKVSIQNLDHNNIRFYPIYRGEPITREYEYGLREALQEDTMENRQVYENQNRFGEEYETLRDRYGHEQESEDPVVKMRAERDIAKAERDILKAENEVLKMQLRNIRKVLSEDFYNHEHFNDSQFYANENTAEASSRQPNEVEENREGEGFRNRENWKEENR